MFDLFVTRTKVVRDVPGLVVAVFLMGGCVSTGGGVSNPLSGATSWVTGVSGVTGGTPAEAETAGPLTPAEQRMRDQSRAFQKTVWEGVLIGASAGAIWGLVKGDDARDVMKKALIGGAAGGLAGAYVAHKQKEYAGKEDQLDSMIADVRESNKQAEELAVSVREVIAEDKRRLASVQKDYKAGRATQAEIENARRRVSENKAVVVQASKGAREKYSMFEGAERSFREQNPGTDTGRLQSELNSYNQQIETLDGLADSISVA
jgi:hypothetical protein